MTKIKAAVLAIWTAIPISVKLLVRDAIEAALGSVVALNLAFPSNLSSAEAEAGVAFTAGAVAFVAVLRRGVLLIFAAWSTPSAPTAPVVPSGDQGVAQ